MLSPMASRQVSEDLLTEDIVQRYLSYGPIDPRYLKADREVSEQPVEEDQLDGDDHYISYLAEVTRRKREKVLGKAGQ